MPIDKVAERQALLDIAYHEGSLNNEQKLRSEIEKFQNRFREQKPSVVDISTDAERQFRADLETLLALGNMTVDREVKLFSLAMVRIVQYLNHKLNLLDQGS